MSKFVLTLQCCRVLPTEIIVAEARTMLYRIFPSLDLKNTVVSGFTDPEIGEDDDEDMALFFADFAIKFNSTNLMELIPKDRELTDYGINLLN